jgi:hypothetical protein
VVAKLGDEESAKDINPLLYGWETVDTAVGAVHVGLVVGGNDIPLDPRAEIDRLLGNLILPFTGIGAPAAADALVDIYAHCVIVLGRIILVINFRSKTPTSTYGSGYQKPLGYLAGTGLKEFTAVDFRFLVAHRPASG